MYTHTHTHEKQKWEGLSSCHISLTCALQKSLVIPAMGSVGARLVISITWPHILSSCWSSSLAVTRKSFVSEDWMSSPLPFHLPSPASSSQWLTPKDVNGPTPCCQGSYEIRLKLNSNWIHIIAQSSPLPYMVLSLVQSLHPNKSGHLSPSL